LQGIGSMSIEQKRLRAKFYRTANGAEPVREWLKNLDQQDRQTIGMDLKDIEYGWPIGMPLCRPLGQGIWEVRSSISHGRIARVLFCIEGDEMVILHGLIKKTQKIPQHDIDLALKRKKGE
jgi:phage-related protein